MHENLRNLIDVQEVIRGEVQKQEDKLTSIKVGSEDKARLFVVTDRDVLRRLDLLKEEHGNTQ